MIDVNCEKKISESVRILIPNLPYSHIPKKPPNFPCFNIIFNTIKKDHTLSHGAMTWFPSTASTNPSLAVVWHQGFRCISSVMTSAKQEDHCLRGYTATTLLMVEAEMRCGLRPTLSVTSK